MSPDKFRVGFGKQTREVENKFPPEAPPVWGADKQTDVVGKDHVRPDAVDKATGRALYSQDRRFEGMLYAKMLRCPHANARVKKLDLTKAKALPGVLYTEGQAGKRITYAGATVAGVAATSEQILEDALRLIEVEYETMPVVATVEDAQMDGAPSVGRRGSNVNQSFQRGNANRVKQLHARAAKVISAEYRTQVQTHSCLETHGSVTVFKDGKVTCYASTQATFAWRQGMARALGLSADDVTVITEHMGGGFGSKFGADEWDLFGARAARETGRPVRSILDRREEHMVGGNRPDSIQRCTFSASGDGQLLGATVESFGTPGNGARGAGVFNPGIYRFQATRQVGHDVRTHAGRARAFRAPRHPQGIFALEGMMDELADALGMDPLALRRKNDPNPVRQAQYDVGAKEIGWDRRKPGGLGDGPLKRGIGIASSRWGHNGRPGTVVRCRIGRDGTVTVFNGAQDIGTGTRSVFAVLTAEELGLDPSQVRVQLGNTNDPPGPASGGSVTTPSITPPTRQAACEAKRELLEAVANQFGGDASKMDLKDGQVIGGPKKLTFAQACKAIAGGVVEGTGRGRGNLFDRSSGFTREVAGVQFAEVEVDTETGIVKVLKVVGVHDCGRVVNTLTTRSQINGGIIQGISYALFENRVLDRRSGDMLNANFLDYKILGAVDMPEIVAIPFSVAQGVTPSGVSSLGEPATVATAAAIANAVSNAIGARVRKLPMTPDVILSALETI
ncbi:MAG: xanthine dehydrogenase family protein molybdopterin-binding subunit [Planctomycetota bacterium]